MAISVESFQWAPKLFVDHAVIPLDHSVDLEECILDFKRVHKDHQQAKEK